MDNDTRDKLLLEMNAKLDTVCSQSEDYHKTLYGNGQPGIAARLQRVETQQKGCPARLKALKDNKMLIVAIFAVSISFASFAYIVLMG